MTTIHSYLPNSTAVWFVVTAMVKYLVDIEEAAIRREAMRMRLGLHGAVVGRGSDGMIKVCDAAAEIAALVCISCR